jgi:hypothetical protein
MGVIINFNWRRQGALLNMRSKYHDTWLAIRFGANAIFSDRLRSGDHVLEIAYSVLRSCDRVGSRHSNGRIGRVFE